MKKFVVEFIGTFFLMLTIALTVTNPNISNFAPLAIGSVLMVMVYSGGYISGAHYNPAVTFAALIIKKISFPQAISYWCAQLLAGGLAGAIALVFNDYPVSKINLVPLNALLAEIIFTFALVYVIFSVAVAKKNQNNFFYGLAIGFTVLAGAYAVGSISGGAFNPAVAIGLLTSGLLNVSDLWIYFLGNLVGAAVAGVLFAWLSDE